MRSRSAAYRRPSKLKTALSAISVMMLTAFASVAALAAFGVVDLKNLFKAATVSNQFEGMVGYPMATTRIPAYTKITRDHLVDPQRQQSVLFYFKPEQVRPDWIREESKILHRVMARDKEPGYIFTEADFLPLGTRPGVVAGIPPGKRAMTLDANQVRGLKQLRIGDRFDLLASEPVDMKGLQPQLRWKNNRNGSSAGPNGQDASVRVLVNNGAVVTLPLPPDPSSSAPRGNSLLGGGDRSAPAREMTIALEPDEIVPLTEALATKNSLFCVARSGHPDEDHTTRVPQYDPMENVQTIETLRGREFGMEAFPNGLQPGPETAPVHPTDAKPQTPLPTGSSAPVKPQRTTRLSKK